LIDYLDYGALGARLRQRPSLQRRKERHRQQLRLDSEQQQALIGLASLASSHFSPSSDPI